MQITKNLQIFFYTGADLLLASAPWKSKVNKVFRITDTGTAWQSFVPTSNFNAVTKLVAGNFYFCDANTLPLDIDGAVLTLVQAAPANVLPAANAGADASITLPTNQLVLLGSGTDADGSISAYSWTQLTGPNLAVLASPNSANTTASGLVEGIYQFRLLVTDNAGASKYDDVVVTVNPSLLTTYTPDTALHYNDNVRNMDGGGFVKRSAFAQVSFETTATEMQVGLYCTFNGYPNLSTVGVLVNGVYHQTIGINGFNALEYHAINNLPAGNKVITLRDGGQDPAPSGTFVQNVRANAQVNWLNKVAPAARFTIYGDSISIGEGATPPDRYGWTMVYRDLMEAENANKRVTVEGWGNRTLADDYGPGVSAQAKADFIQLLGRSFDGTTRNVFISNIGRNDFGLNAGAISAADFGVMYGQFMDAFHAAFPAVEFFAVTPIASSQDAEEEPWRQAVRSAGLTRPWVTVLNGPDMMPANQLGDGIHPNQQGHNTLAHNLYLSTRTAGGLRALFSEINDPGVQLTGSFSTETSIRAPDTGDVLYKGDRGNYSLDANAAIQIAAGTPFRRLRIFYPKVPFGGEQDVYVDGVKVGTFDTYKAYGTMYLAEFNYDFPDYAPRTIRIVPGAVRNTPDFFFDDIELY